MKRTIMLLIILLLITGCDLLNESRAHSTNIDIEKNSSNNIIENIEQTSSSVIDNEENEYVHFNSGYEKWLKSTQESKYVITLIGASYCGHCKNFKPVLETIADKYNIDLYFYYIDEIDGYEKSLIMDKYDTNYEGSVPHMFITKNSVVINNTTGSMSESELIEFLKLNLVIE